MIEVLKGHQLAIGGLGSIFVGIQCACGWSVITWSPIGDESHHDLYDRAEVELGTHVELAKREDECQPWLRR